MNDQNTISFSIENQPGNVIQDKLWRDVKNGAALNFSGSLTANNQYRLIVTSFGTTSIQSPFFTVSKSRNGESCTTATDCESGSRCLNTVCRPNTYCDIPTDCSAPNRFCVSKTCTTGGVNQACTTPADCDTTAGLSCNQGFCTSSPPPSLPTVLADQKFRNIVSDMPLYCATNDTNYRTLTEEMISISSTNFVTYRQYNQELLDGLGESCEVSPHVKKTSVNWSGQGTLDRPDTGYVFKIRWTSAGTNYIAQLNSSQDTLVITNQTPQREFYRNWPAQWPSENWFDSASFLQLSSG